MPARLGWAMGPPTDIDAKHHNIDAKLLIEEGVFGVHNSWVVMFGVDLQQAFNDSPQVW